VDEVSGVMDIPKETPVPMDGCDHQDICRFGDPTSPGYRKVSFHLEKLANGQSTIFCLIPHHASRLWMLLDHTFMLVIEHLKGLCELVCLFRNDIDFPCI
jgi:hypothetical protein